MSFVVSDCEKKYFLRWFLLVAAMSSCPFIGYTEEPINPSNSFYLPAAEVPKMESAASLVVGAALSLWRGRRRSPRCSSCSSSPSRRRPCADSTSRAAASAARPPAAWSPPSSATCSCWPSPSGWRLAADRAAGEPLAFPDGVW